MLRANIADSLGIHYVYTVISTKNCEKLMRLEKRHGVRKMSIVTGPVLFGSVSAAAAACCTVVSAVSRTSICDLSSTDGRAGF